MTDHPAHLFFSIGMKIENWLKKKEHISQKKSKKNYTTYTLKILRFYETLLFMQFELLFSSICDFVKIDVLTLPPELSCLLFSVRSILFSWLPFFLSPLIPILRKEFNKNQNLEKKQKNLKIYCLTIWKKNMGLKTD